jgi:hypothetical protein
MKVLLPIDSSAYSDVAIEEVARSCSGRTGEDP